MRLGIKFFFKQKNNSESTFVLDTTQQFIFISFVPSRGISNYHHLYATDE